MCKKHIWTELKTGHLNDISKLCKSCGQIVSSGCIYKKEDAIKLIKETIKKIYNIKKIHVLIRNKYSKHFGITYWMDQAVILDQYEDIKIYKELINMLKR